MYKFVRSRHPLFCKVIWFIEPDQPEWGALFGLRARRLNLLKLRIMIHLGAPLIHGNKRAKQSNIFVSCWCRKRFIIRSFNPPTIQVVINHNSHKDYACEYADTVFQSKSEKEKKQHINQSQLGWDRWILCGRSGNAFFYGIQAGKLVFTLSCAGCKDEKSTDRYMIEIFTVGPGECVLVFTMGILKGGC